MIWLSQIKWRCDSIWTLIWYLLPNSLKVISSKHFCQLLLSFLWLFLHHGFLLFYPSFRTWLGNLFASVFDDQRIWKHEMNIRTPGKDESTPVGKTFHFENWDFIKFPFAFVAQLAANLKYAHNWKDIEWSLRWCATKRCYRTTAIKDFEMKLENQKHNSGNRCCETLSLQYEHFGQLVHTSYAAIYCKGIEMIDICWRMFAV